MKETERTINEWAEKEFGKADNPLYSVERLIKEIRELAEAARDLREFPSKETASAFLEELADCEIIIRRMGGTFWNEWDPSAKESPLEQMVSAKMATNRSRRWMADGTGHGYHIPDPPTTNN